MEVLLILLGLAIPIAWSAAFFMALGARNRLLALELRFAGLERRLAETSAAATAPPPPADLGQATAPASSQQSEPAAPSEEPQIQTAATNQPAPEQESAEAPNAAPPQQTSTPSGEPVASAPKRPAPEGVSGPPAAGPGFEERLGTRWVVWVGGVALALGAIFLVRYSIEEGLIGPGMRVFFGGLLAMTLIAAGEWARRKEALLGLPGLPQASIPAILTAAGTTAAYATVWAAHGLYGFIGPAIAFPLLGIVALVTLAAALLHGPALAGLGLVGAYVTPMLVSSQQPNFWALYVYLAVVTAAAFALARVRLWRWLAITAVAFSVAWMLPGLGSIAWQISVPGQAVAPSVAPHIFHAFVGFVLTAALIVSGLLFGPEQEDESIDRISSGSLCAFLFAAMLVVLVGGHATLALVAYALLTAGLVAIVWRTTSAAAALPVAALFAAFVIADWALAFEWRTLVAPAGPTAGTIPQPGQIYFGGHLSLGAAFAALFGVAGFLAQGRYGRALIPLLWAASALIAPVAILIALYYRIANFERSIPFAALALLLAALYATATEYLSKRERKPGLTAAEALFAVGAVASLSLALTMALEEGWLTVAFALMAPGIAMIAEKRPLPLLRWLAAGVAVLVAGRVMWEPRIVTDVGTTPIFNWLLWGYGVPAVSFWTAAYLLRRRADDVPVRMLDSAAILFTVLTLTLEIRHYVNGGDIYRANPGLLEVGLHVSALLAVAIGLERVRGRTRSIVHDAGAVIVAVLALLLAVVGLLILENPLFRQTNVGGAFVNLILLSYGVPAGLAIMLALIAKETRPMPYRAIAAAASVVLALSYLTLQVRRLFHGPVIDIVSSRSGEPVITDPEMWAHSAVWLTFGVVLLFSGILLRSQPARMASAAVIFLTVLKVFLIDLAEVGGVWRPLSFIGLGLVLVGIGWLYQRLLFPPRANPQAPGSATEGVPTS